LNYGRITVQAFDWSGQEERRKTPASIYTPTQVDTKISKTERTEMKEKQENIKESRDKYKEE
jgi:hypothetical protein